MNTVWSADYLPFGQADVTVGTVENNLRFAGQYFDAETGLHYNYYRYYDPRTGRYLRKDPVGVITNYLRARIIVQEVDGNLYLYVHNSPTTSGDYLGLMPGVGKDCPSGTYSSPKKNPPPHLLMAADLADGKLKLFQINP